MDLPSKLLERVDRGLDIAQMGVNMYSYWVTRMFPVEDEEVDNMSNVNGRDFGLPSRKKERENE